MRISILGAGEVGTHLARALIGDGHQVILIDSSPEAVQKARDGLDIEVIEGHGGNVDVLETAGVAQADLFCAVTYNDELNMLASLLAKKLGARQTAVRVRGLSHVTRKRFFYRKTLDFDLTISPEEMTATAISREVRGQDLTAVESVAEGKIQLHRFELSGRFDAAGRKIKDIKLPRQCLIAALVRGTSILIPGGDDEIHLGDEVLLIGATETMERVDKILGGRMQLPRRIMIVGGGRAGVAAATTLLRLRLKVVILEKERARCEVLSELLPGAEIVNADGTNLQHLLEEGVERIDLFLALTEKDEINLITCQLAAELGVGQTVAQVWKPGYQELTKRFNLSAVISPRTLIAERILRFVRAGGNSRVTSIEQGRAEIIELDLNEGSPLVKKPLKDVTFPRGALVGAVIRGEDAFVPRGLDVLEPGDTVIVFALTQARRSVEALSG
ncbi:MAG: Trk system potassium transporter TrkA [Planctomycetes bacterium]|nr:Trk system potassium transporter TrkA [Planctomycetota bacterium]